MIRPWEAAWADALYGPAGFYRRAEGPAGHFRTAAHASPRGLLGRAIAALARASGCTAVLDVGAGRGELLTAVAAADPALTCTGVDVRPRPVRLPERIGWAAEPSPASEPTLLVGWELLDVVPCPVLQLDGEGLARVVHVACDGAEVLGPAAAPADRDWCARWWPLEGLQPGDRVEVGRTRDAAWAELVHLLDGVGGLALAVDYGHDAAHRPRAGTLAGYRSGRLVAPVPDGSTDVTAHVALDAVAAVRAPALRLPQHAALRRLGVAAHRPPVSAAAADATDYLAALADAGEAAELVDPGGLGAFGWVLHPVGEPASAKIAKWTSGAAT